MYNQQPTDNLSRIREMLSKIEEGDFNYSIPEIFHNKGFGSIFLLIEMMLSEFERILNHAKMENPQTLVPESYSITAREKLLILKVTVYIHENLRQNLPTAIEVANKFGTNQRKLKEGFSKMHNMGIHQYFTMHRLNEVHKEILNEPGDSLTEIAERFGYYNYHSFYCAFVRQFKYSPKDARKPNKPEI